MRSCQAVLSNVGRLRMHFGSRIGLGFFTLVVTGCHHVSYGSESMKIEGFRYSVGSAVVGVALDSLRVAMVVVNDSRQERFLSFPHCPPVLNPVKVIVRGNSKEWNSETSEIRTLPQYFDSTGKPLAQVCLLDLMGMSFPPGGSYTYILKVPVVEILGDSLPAGRYHVTAQLRLNGYLTRRFAAGDVEFSAPRPPALQ